jgi:hypothetical protein
VSGVADDENRSRESTPIDRRARFAQALVLSKREAFDLCEACADAERALLRAGRPVEAARMASTFELVEGRLVVSSSNGVPGQPTGHHPPSGFSGSNSRESELTQ